MGYDVNERGYRLLSRKSYSYKGFSIKTQDLDVDVKLNEADLVKAINRLKGLGDKFPTNEIHRLIKKAARPMLEAARANTPVAPKEVLYYNTPKLSKRRRAPKGKGKVSSRVAPGTARRALRIKARKNQPAVILGPRTGYGKNAANYFHFLEFDVVQVDGSVRKGAAPMRKALNATKNQVIENIVKASAEVVERYAEKKT